MKDTTWHEGSFGHIPTDEVVHYVCRAFAVPRENGLEGGRITYMRISKKGTTTAEYKDGVWVKAPDEADRATIMMYWILIKEYN